MRKSNKICLIESCNGKIVAKGYCNKHYRKFKKYGDPLYVLKNMDRDPICTVEGCNNKHNSLGYCKKHYERFKQYGDPLYERFYREIEYHNMTNTPEYQVWTNMKQRCYNPKKERYPCYGGRGITICDRWKNSFVNFYADMGKRPTTNHQIDRIDNDGNYEPGNCQWITQLENIRNSSIIKNSTEIASKIRKEYALGNTSYRKLELKYNIDFTIIGKIINNKIWVNP